MPERLHSEQYIINKVFDPINNTLRVETETAIVVSGLTISTSSTVNQGRRGPEPWIVSGLVTVSNPSSSSGGVVIQGNSTGAPWIVSGTVTVANPTTASAVLANQGARGPEPWPISGIVVSSLTVDTFTSLASGISSVQGLTAVANRRLLGFSATETASANAELILHHGTSNAGTIISWITLNPKESTRDWFGDAGLAVANGVYVNRIAGTTQITLFHRTEV